MFNPEIEMMPREALRKLQNERLQKLVNYVYERVPFYQNAFEQQAIKPSDIKSVEDIHKLPLTRKQDLRDNYPFKLFAVPMQEVRRIHASSGTTGKPTVVGYTQKDIDIFAEVNARSMAAAGARPGMIFHNAYGYGLFTGGLGLHYGGERLGLAVIPVSGGMTERQLTLIQDMRPEVISCTPSYAQTLAEEFHKRGVSPEDLSLKYAVLGAEPWTDAIRKAVEAGLGVKATNIYGLSEIIGPGVSNEAVEEQEGSYIWEDHFYPEIVHPETGAPLPEGEAGVLVITTLTKEALPLIRYWTGDITTLRSDIGITGRTHRRMGMILGRSDDMIIVRGVNVYPSQIEAVLDNMADLAMHYQLILSREGTMDALELKMELSEDAFIRFGKPDMTNPPDDLKNLAQKVINRIKDTIGISTKVNLLAPNSVPRSEGGKLRRIIDTRKL
ncbi:MAG: phenylacetate--CoA ligase [Deinococcales bacterium]